MDWAQPRARFGALTRGTVSVSAHTSSRQDLKLERRDYISPVTPHATSGPQRTDIADRYPFRACVLKGTSTHRVQAHSGDSRDYESGHFDFGGLRHASYTSLHRFAFPDHGTCSTGVTYGRTGSSGGPRPGSGLRSKPQGLSQLG